MSIVINASANATFNIYVSGQDDVRVEQPEQKPPVEYTPRHHDFGEDSYSIDVSDQSSFVERITYIDHHELLIVQLTSGTYVYRGVPADVADDFRDAGSFGRFYNREIKGRYEF